MNFTKLKDMLKFKKLQIFIFHLTSKPPKYARTVKHPKNGSKFNVNTLITNNKNIKLMSQNMSCHVIFLST